MRAGICSLTLLCGLAIPAVPCLSAVDTEAEKTAIRAVLEEEKAGFFARDAAKMADTWVHGPAVMKLYVTEKGETRFVGWDAVSAHDKQNVAGHDADLSQLKVEFSDYHITVSDHGAWAVLKATWVGSYKGEKIDIVQTRVNVLEKVDGKWKFVLMAIYNLPPKPTEAKPGKP